MILNRDVVLSQGPYPGLRPFLSTEADIFFGREEQTDQLLKRLQTSHFLAIVGPSGCGKSSLVRAGMISALTAGFLPEAGARWRIAEMRPGDKPFERLANALTAPSALAAEIGDAPDAAAFVQATLQRGPLGLVELLREMPLPESVNLLLLVDQFEEIFRFSEDGTDAADAFIALLLATANQRQVYVVITMRSDYLSQCALFAGLAEAMNDSQFLTPRLTREQTAAAIDKPIRVFGGQVDPGLTNRLLNDMGPDANQLPLLQHCLMRMWLRVNGRLVANGHGAPPEKSPERDALMITMEDYRAVGMLDQALSTHADEVLNRLNSEQQRIAQIMFRRLTERSAAGHDTRHPARMADIAGVAGVDVKDLADVVEEFRKPDRSFITPPAGTQLNPETVLDITHESLITLWHTLDTWVNKESESAANYSRWKESAELHARHQADLLGQIDLARALEWQKDENPTIHWSLRYGTADEFQTVMTFLDESVKQRERLGQAEGQRQRNKLLLGYGISLLLLIFLVVTLIKWRDADKSLQVADQARKAAEDARQGAELEAEHNRRLHYDMNLNFSQREFDEQRLSSIPILLDEFLAPDLSSVRDFVWYYFWRLAHKEKGTLSGHTQEVYAVAFSPDASRVATGSRDGTIKLWDAKTHTVLISITGHDNSVTSIAYSPDGKMMASGSWDKTAKLWNTDTCTELATLAGHDGAVFSVAFSADGKTVATASKDKTVKLWNVADHKEIVTLTPDDDAINSVAFSPDGRFLATAGWAGKLKVWDAATHRLRTTLNSTEGFYSTAFSPDSKYIGGSSGNVVKIWDALTFNKKEEFEADDSVYQITFSRDGRVAAASSNKTAEVWEIGTHKPVTTFTGHSAAVISVNFAPDGKTLVTGSADMTAKLWDVGERKDPPELQGHSANITSVEFSPDGNIIATASEDMTVRIWDSASHNQLAVLSARSAVEALAFSPDGKQLATANDDNTVTVWDISTRSVLRTLIGHSLPVQTVRFSPNGELIATAGWDKSVRLWETATGKALATLTNGQAQELLSVAFSPDGEMLVSGGQEGTVNIWKVATHELLDTLAVHTDNILSIAFSPDGKLLATASYEKNVTLWDVATRKELKTFTSHSGPVYRVIFSPDGKTLVTGSHDKTVKLWDVASLQELATLRLPSEHLDSIAFSPDGRILAATNEKTVHFWRAATEAEVESQRR
ncbi:MAG TPA: hypothetical protein DC054_11585 [Blastocatellia bacterium]|nr:hypothetical protein [Blastocatellia bacterium]